ncbi:MAG: pilus assembly protein N-terminal domain-containing protein [Methylobacterium sp.]|nr:pilus assembly protein N-terminal domain-containing protein [Methylobacterium sp.]
MSRLRLPALGVMLAAMALGAPASANETGPDQIGVFLDQAKLLKLPTGTETIIVGNPAIADVTVQRNGVLIITGRLPGRTNFIALDTNGTIISESFVSVSAPPGNGLLVMRGLDSAHYHCAPNCQPTVALGDEEKHFGRAADQSIRRDALANQSSAAGAKR